MKRLLPLAVLLSSVACGHVTGWSPAPAEPGGSGGEGGAGEGGSGGEEGGSGGAQGGSGGEDDGSCIFFHEPANCSEGSDRICSRVIPDENNPDALTLSQDKRGEGSDNSLYVAIPDRDAVAKVDTYEQQKLWQVSSQGTFPHALQKALDGSVWVANQGLEGEDLVDFSNVVHLDRDGNVICRAPVPGLARALAVDPNGDIWVGSLHSQRLFTIAGNTTLGVDDAGFPVCKSVGPPDGLDASHPVMAIAVDDRGILWTASSTETTIRLDTEQLTRDEIHHGGPSTEVAVDFLDGRVFFGGFSAHRIAADGPYVDPQVYEQDGLPSPDAMLLTHDQIPFAARGFVLIQLDPVSLQADRTLPLFGTSTGLAEGSQGELWSAHLDGTLRRSDRTTGAITELEIDAGHPLEMAGDPSGSRTRGLPEYGTWLQVVERQDPTTWVELRWNELRPGATRIRASARFGATREEVLGIGPGCSTYAGPPLDLTACPGSVGARFAAFSFSLRGARDGSKPTVGNIGACFSP